MNTNKRTMCRRGGFSLTEMLIATGIMAIGLVLVALIFPVGVKLTTLTTEKTIAAVVADEAFAKIQLYGLRDFSEWPSAIQNPVSGSPDPDATYEFCDLFKYTTPVEVTAGGDSVWDTGDDSFAAAGPDGIYGTADDIPVNLNEEFFYPSEVSQTGRKYRWSALCRRVDDKDVQVTVVVTRMTFDGVSYYTFPYDAAGSSYRHQDTADHPVPVSVNVEYDPTDTSTSTYLRELEIDMTGLDNIKWENLSTNSVYTFLDEGYTIVNGRDGKIYRVLELKDMDDDDGDSNTKTGTLETIVLYEDWQWDGYEADPSSPPTTPLAETIWVVPPGLNSSRYPCVGVFQKIIRFDDIEN